MQYLVGAIAAGLLALYAWERWRNRDSALPAAMENQKKAEIRADESDAKLKTATEEGAQAKREAEAAVARAEAAERALHAQLKASLPHLPGAALLMELRRLLQEASTAPPAPAGGGDGDADPGRVPPTVVDPWASDHEP